MKTLSKIALVAAVAGVGYFAYTRYSKRYLTNKVLKVSGIEDTPENRAKIAEGQTAADLRELLNWY